MITRITCDACGCYCKDGLHGTVEAVVGTHTDAAGSIEKDWEQADLCVACLVKCMNEWLKSLPMHLRKEWFERVKKTPSV